MQNDGLYDVDNVITTRELSRMIKQANIEFEKLADGEFDQPMGEASGAGAIFGTTGGVMEAALRTAQDTLTGEDLQKIDRKITEQNEKDRRIPCNVCGDMQLPAIRVDNSVKGNFFSNLNTGERYDYPLFVNGKCTLKVLKGVYIFAFDGTATLTDGSTRRVRCYEHRSPNDSVNIIDGDVEITIELLPL